ncbi:hypothetical protein B0H15DRAFT_947401 [Mycena belliarum]|uniref:Uncharacterized protein n=1 Tax=Mycena belliarum TaxID=1033014 RepID=A0AAD6U9T5_9AGAR|nr:hypothetical protein B0H15DRAFT_947401 [Mycena belliae]
MLPRNSCSHARPARPRLREIKFRWNRSASSCLKRDTGAFFTRDTGTIRARSCEPELHRLPSPTPSSSPRSQALRETQARPSTKLPPVLARALRRPTARAASHCIASAALVRRPSTHGTHARIRSASSSLAPLPQRDTGAALTETKRPLIPKATSILGPQIQSIHLRPLNSTLLTRDIDAGAAPESEINNALPDTGRNSPYRMPSSTSMYIVFASSAIREQRADEGTSAKHRLVPRGPQTYSSARPPSSKSGAR